MKQEKSREEKRVDEPGTHPSGSAVNSFFDQGNFEAMKTLSSWEAASCDEHPFRAKIKVSTYTVLELSLFEKWSEQRKNLKIGTFATADFCV